MASVGIVAIIEENIGVHAWVLVDREALEQLEVVACVRGEYLLGRRPPQMNVDAPVDEVGLLQAKAAINMGKCK